MLSTDHLSATATLSIARTTPVSHPLQQALETGALPLAAAGTSVLLAGFAAIDQATWQGVAVVIASVGSMLALVIDRYYRARKESGALELDLLQRENAILREQLSDARRDREILRDAASAVNHDRTPPHGTPSPVPPVPLSTP